VLVSPSQPIDGSAKLVAQGCILGEPELDILKWVLIEGG